MPTYIDVVSDLIFGENKRMNISERNEITLVYLLSSSIALLESASTLVQLLPNPIRQKNKISRKEIQDMIQKKEIKEKNGKGINQLTYFSFL